MSARRWRLVIRGPDAVRTFQTRLRETQDLMAKVGALFVAQAKQAFREQRLGGTFWPERYPHQKGAFINIWPVVMQAGEGRTPVAIDFEKRPALRDRFGVSIAEGVAVERAGRTTVVVGHKEPWAGVYQYGAITRLQITERTRLTLWDWLFGKSTKGPKKGKEEYARKLAFVFQRDELVGKPYPRPFIGMTEQIADDIDETVARHLGAESSGA